MTTIQMPSDLVKEMPITLSKPSKGHNGQEGAIANLETMAAVVHMYMIQIFQFYVDFTDRQTDALLVSRSLNAEIDMAVLSYIHHDVASDRPSRLCS